MLFGTTRELDDKIVTSLEGSPLAGPVLFSILSKHKKLSKETFYRTLKRLLKEEVLVKNKKMYALNHHWLEKLQMFSSKHIEKNTSVDIENILSLKDGDRISYRFKNPNLMGIYWAHTYDLVYKSHDANIPILIYHPHEWLIFGRPESETHFLKRFSQSKKLVHFAIGGKDALDRQFKKEWENKYMQVGTGIDIGLMQSEYLNVLGDYIFRVSVGERFAKQIKEIFNNEKVASVDFVQKIKILLEKDENSKFIFKKSKKEADMWRSKFKKYFHTPNAKNIA